MADEDPVQNKKKVSTAVADTSGENESPEDVSEDQSEDIVEVKAGKSKGITDVVKNIANRAGRVISEKMKVTAPVRNRTVQRRNALLEASKWKHEKTIIAGNNVWEDHPPEMNIGEINMRIDGGVGKVTHVEYMADPKTGGHMRDPSGGGYIKVAFVEEKIEPMQQIKRTRTAISGVPSLEEAQKRWDETYAAERRRVNKAEGDRDWETNATLMYPPPEGSLI